MRRGHHEEGCVKLQIGFLASGGGTNMQAIIDACREGRVDGVPRAVISNNSTSGALERARQAGVPGYHLSSRTHPEPDALDQAILKVLTDNEVSILCLAGYMKLLGPKTIEAYRGRILNIHPALLPRHGGRGCYGHHVHEAVLAAGDRESGPTVHVVDERYDEGPILAQIKVPVLPDDTPETLAARVLEQEHRIYPEALQAIASGKIKLEGEVRT